MLLFIAAMDTAVEIAKNVDTEDDTVAAIYAEHGRQLYEYVGGDYTKGREALVEAMDYLRMHDCSLEAAEQLQSSYDGQFGTPHNHVGHAHGDDYGPVAHTHAGTKAERDKKKKEKEKRFRPGWLELFLKYANKQAKQRA